ncbi:unnamed protein product [Brassica oleracea var. botrytis]
MLILSKVDSFNIVVLCFDDVVHLRLGVESLFLFLVAIFPLFPFFCYLI